VRYQNVNSAASNHNRGSNTAGCYIASPEDDGRCGAGQSGGGENFRVGHALKSGRQVTGDL